MTELVLAIIQQHTSGNPISMPTLAARVGTGTREVQESVQTLRARGELIGSSCGRRRSGYYYATPEEAMQVIEQYEHRAWEIRKAAARMRKRAKMNRPGQIHLGV